MLFVAERGHIHEESTNVIHQIIRTCEEKMAEIDTSPDKEEGKGAFTLVRLIGQGLSC